MPETIAKTLIAVAVAYLTLGLIAAVALHVRGLARLDPSTAGAGLPFRLLITPGLVALWPLALLRWMSLARSTRDTASPRGSDIPT